MKFSCLIVFRFKLTSAFMLVAALAGGLEVAVFLGQADDSLLVFRY